MKGQSPKCQPRGQAEEFITHMRVITVQESATRVKVITAWVPNGCAKEHSFANLAEARQYIHEITMAMSEMLRTYWDMPPEVLSSKDEEAVCNWIKNYQPTLHQPIKITASGGCA